MPLPQPNNRDHKEAPSLRQQDEGEIAKPIESVHSNSTPASLRQQPTPDREEILRALAVLTEPGQTIELRVLGVTYTARDGTSGKSRQRGYFRDHRKLADAATRITERADGVYVTINPVLPDLYARATDRIERADRGTSTTDSDIVRRRWLVLDVDPERPSGVSATNAEHDEAITFGRETMLPFLRAHGWPDPVVADSGNGIHLLYRIDLPNDDAAKSLVDRVLQVLAVEMAALNPRQKLDTTVGNAARIIKLYGTVARKGDHIPERPHRLAHLLDVPDQLAVVSAEQLEALVGELGTKNGRSRPAAASSPSRITRIARRLPSASPRNDFDTFAWLDAFLERHSDQLDLEPEEPYDHGGRKWQFNVCPFDDTHENKPAVLIQRADGTIQFTCLNASCHEHDWYELRELVGEPKREREERDLPAPPADDTGFPPEPDELELTPDIPVGIRKQGGPVESGTTTGAAQAMVAQAAKTGDVDLLRRARDLPEAEDLSDVGDATLLEALFCRVLKHTPENGWLAWNEQTGGWNARDGNKAAERRIRQVLDLRAKEAAELVGTDYGKKLFAHVHRACDRVPNIARAAISFPHLSAHYADFDKNDWLLGVVNGVVDLRTGILAPHAPENMITRVAPVAYYPEATCPRWDQFLREVLVAADGHPDMDLIRFFHKACGYSATGSIREEVLFLCNGGGKNGKSVALGTLRYVLGDYGGVLDPDELASKAQHSETQPKLVALVGKRLITAIEPKERGYGQNVEALDSVMVRRLTGKDGMQIRTLHQEPFEYYPVWKIWLAMNKLPAIHDDSEGTWRRIRVIPFNASFNGREEPGLEETLKAEAEGILAWIVRGARLWLNEGLGTVRAVEDKSDAYRGKEDPLFAFVRDELVREPGASVLQQEAFLRYEAWRKEVQDDFDAPWLSSRDFGRRLEAHNIQRKKCKDGQHFLDCRLITDEDRTAQVVTKVTDRPQITDIPHEKSSREKSQNWGLNVTNVTSDRAGHVDAVLRDERADTNAICAFCGGLDDTGQGYCRACGGQHERRIPASAVVGAATCPATGKPHRVVVARGGLWQCARCRGVWALDDLPIGSEKFAMREDGLIYVQWTGRDWYQIAMPDGLQRLDHPACREVSVLTADDSLDSADDETVDAELDRASRLIDLDDDIPF